MTRPKLHLTRRLALVLAAAAGLVAPAAAHAASVPTYPANGIYTISPAHTLGTMVLDVAGASGYNGAPIIQWQKYGAAGAPNQQFLIEQVPSTLHSPVYRIRPQHVAN